MNAAKEHIDSVMAMVAANMREVSRKHLNECYDIWKSQGPGGLERIMKERAAARERSNAEEFERRYKLPCGHYRDPGGHP